MAETGDPVTLDLVGTQLLAMNAALRDLQQCVAERVGTSAD
jgi:hypothetical protein